MTEYIVLRNGLTMPSVNICPRNDRVQAKTLFIEMLTTIKAGCRHIEIPSTHRHIRTMGRAIRESCRLGIVARQNLFITLAVPITPNYQAKNRVGSFGDRVVLALNLLGIGKIELLLATIPARQHLRIDQKRTNRYPVRAIWAQMADFYNSKQTRAIGVRNWTVHNLREVVQTRLAIPHLCSFGCRHEEAYAFCRAHGMIIASYPGTQ